MVVIFYVECVFLFIFDMLSQDESKKHFSEQFIAKGVRPSGGGKPRGGGRGRGGRGSRPHTGSTASQATRDSKVTDDGRYTERWSSESSSGLSQNEDDPDITTELHDAALLALSRDSDVETSDTTIEGCEGTKNEDDKEVIGDENLKENSKNDASTSNTLCEDQAEISPPLSMASTTSHDNETLHPGEITVHPDSTSTFVATCNGALAGAQTGEEEASVKRPPPPPPRKEDNLHCDEITETTQMPSLNLPATPSTPTAFDSAETSCKKIDPTDKVVSHMSGIDDQSTETNDIVTSSGDDDFSQIVVKKKTPEVPKKKGLWGLIKKK